MHFKYEVHDQSVHLNEPPARPRPEHDKTGHGSKYRQEEVRNSVGLTKVIRTVESNNTVH